MAIRICYYQQSHFSSLVPLFLFLFLCISAHTRTFSPVGSDGGSEECFGTSAVDVTGCVWVLCKVVAVIFTHTHQGNPVSYELNANQRVLWHSAQTLLEADALFG